VPAGTSNAVRPGDALLSADVSTLSD
jgi:hypothetical protein